MSTQRLTREARRRLEVSLMHEPGSRSAFEARHSHPLPQVDADQVLAAAAATGQRWVTPGQSEWPESLDDLAAFGEDLDPIGGAMGAPLGLWVRGAGRLDELAATAIAVVGARTCTTYGAEVAGDLAADCADAGFTIISGAAFGIDAQAHRGALSLERPTIAVLACGTDVDYPRAHAAMLSRIGAEGLIVSEYPPGTPPLKHRFLARNRLIAGLSLAVVVVEAARRSGSLNTLHWADQLGRATMAVPGPVTSKQSGGTHEAIRNGKSVLVTSGRDVIDDLSGSVSETPAPPGVSALGPLSRRVFAILDSTPRPMMEVARRVRANVLPVRWALVDLEHEGIVSVCHIDGVEAWSRGS